MLSVGHKYISKLTVINGAGLIATYETNGFIVENTPPEISWIRVGVLSGLEHLIDGYVYQSDPHGIKVSWSASDLESGISGIQYSIGNTKGADNIVPWTETEVSTSSAYLPCTLNITETDGSNHPMYYVSLKARNGAGLWSQVKISSPIVVLQEDVTGVVHDGPYESLNDDVDYQADSHTITMRFSGFESSLHGIMNFDWAIGTEPGTEDVQPFLEGGIINVEEDDIALNGIESAGFAQTTVDLDHGITYYSTLRVKTNKGNILQATTNGFVVDTTPPKVMFMKLSDSTTSDIDSVIYQMKKSVLEASWNYSDSEHVRTENLSNIESTWFAVGSYPYSEDIYNRAYQNISQDNTGFLPVGQVKPSLSGISNIVSVGAINKAGLEKTITSPPVVQDNTAPIAGVVSCPKFVQSHSIIECTWTGFSDAESEIEKYEITFGSKQGYDDLMMTEVVPGLTNRYLSKDVKKDHTDVLYATIKAINKVGLSVSAFSDTIVVDDTPPSPGIVVELSSVARVDPYDVDKTVEMNRKACLTKDECSKIDAVCTEDLTHLGVAWTHFSDDESEISEYQLAIGTSPGGAQISKFISLSSNLNHYIVKYIDLKGQQQVFATVKALNFAGLSTSAHSNGVYLSYISQGLPPLKHIGIYDSHQHAVGDVDFQSNTNSIEAKWDVSGDPCPVLKYEWSVEETDGTVLQEFIDMYTSTYGRTDQFDLKEGRRYYSLLRVQNLLGFTYTLRSDGVTIKSNPMLPGMVYDGDVTGYDLKVLSSRTMVSANWEGFGELHTPEGVSEILTGNSGIDQGGEADPEQQVAYYEVALGTDRRFGNTRDNVVPFTNIGLNTSVIFKDLNLTPGFAVYYFTVRAYSASATSATVTSNGFYVSYDGGVFAGTINMPDFVNSNIGVEVQWNDFTSSVGIMMYYVAISDHLDNASMSMDCRKYVDGGKATEAEKSKKFNVYSVTNNGVSTYLSINNLTLKQNSSYFMWIMGIDKAGECNMTYHKFTVDITSPENGKVTAGPYFDMALAYASSSSEIPVKWQGFNDSESGIEVFNLTLWQSGHCSDIGSARKLLETVEVFGNYTEYKFINLSIEGSKTFYITLQAINRAKLITSAETSPIVYDDSIPTAGHISEGSVFADDLVWWGFTDHVDGTLLHSPLHVSDPCPSRQISMTTEGWQAIEIKKLNNSNSLDWKLEHREANLNIDTYSDELSIKIARDSKAERIYSAAYMRNADMKDGGSYEILIQAADGAGIAVTGVTFLDGDHNGLHIFSHQTKEWSNYGFCSCCLEKNITNCNCNCSAYTGEMTDNNDTIDENRINTTISNARTSSVASQQSCGLQIYSGNPYLVTWCKFANNTGESMAVRSDIDFDPSGEFHHYRIVFTNIKEDLLVTTCISVFADGHQMSEMCGIPRLSSYANLILHVWNKDNIVPALDIFNLWQAKAVFKNLIMPPDLNSLCRFGDLFQGGTNAIVKYEAGVGTMPGSVDVVQYQEVTRPCIPCADACSLFVCNQSCSSHSYTLIPFTIQHAELNASYDKALFVTVKAVLGSGAYAVSSSDGFYIDTTPPVFDEEVMMYIDVRQGEYTPTDFQGSNNTIKSLWLCNDDKSEIEEYKWAIGTDVGLEDIQPYTSTGTYSTGINDSLDGELKHNSTYYVSIQCTNSAGLTTTWEDRKGVTVLLVAPDPDTVKASAVGAKSFVKEVFPPTAVESTSSTSCGESWTVSTDPNIRRYDFCVGSSIEIKDDIVPCVWVGYNTSGIVEIKNGGLYINNTSYLNISELRALSKGIYDYSLTDTVDNLFNMETGRTLFLFMRLCNKAEICSDKFVNSLIITKEESMLMRSKTNESKAFRLIHSQSKRVKRSALEITLEMPDGMKNGQSILYNLLTEEDLTTGYGSGASTTFKPYIVNPDDTINSTERLLFRRINFFNMSFTLSPIGQTPFPGPVKLSYPDVYTGDNDTETMVIHWNPDDNQWQISNRTCTFVNDTFDKSMASGMLVILICDTRLSEDSMTKNHTDQTYLTRETQFAIAAISSRIVNNPPLFINISITIDEDSEDTEFQLLAYDMENDPFIFSLQNEEALYPFGNLSLNKDGILTVHLCQHCYGKSSVAVTVEDRPHAEDILPSGAKYMFDIDVSPINDPPSINVLSLNGTSILPKDPTDSVLIFREQTEEIISEIVAAVIAYDVDVQQTLQLISNTTHTSSSFHLKEIGYDVKMRLLLCESEMCTIPSLRKDASSIELKGVYISYTQHNTSFYGMDTIKLVAQDESGAFSDVVSITVVVMENKCQHGQCRSLNPQQYSCTDTRRAIDFDLYYTCECPESWKGAYCESDVDECSLGLCEAWKICNNEIGGYDCYCKPSDIICKLSLEMWEFAVIVTAIVLLIIVVFAVLIRRKFKSKKYEKKTDSFDKETSESSVSLKALLKNTRGLGPSRNRRRKIFPLNTEEENDMETTVPPISTFISSKYLTDLPTPDSQPEDIGFVHPKPRFDRAKLAAEIKQRIKELEASNRIVEEDHPPPELQTSHLSTIYHKSAIAPEGADSDFQPDIKLVKLTMKDLETTENDKSAEGQLCETEESEL